MKPIQLAVQVTIIVGLASSLLFMSTGCAGTEQLSAGGRRAPISGPIALAARPLPVELDPEKTAVIVVDMQNDFGAKGGMLDRAGIDITQIQKAVAPIARTLTAARGVEIPIIYLKDAFRPDLSDMGAKGSPNWIASERGGVGKKILAPNGVESRVHIRDTWNTDILDELKPATGDVVLYKNRFSGFYQTELDAILKRNGIRYLIFTGCTTSVCVESTVRDAMFRDYSPVVLTDCTAEPIGYGLPRSNYDASLLLIQTLFGSVSSSDEFIKAVEAYSRGRR